MNAREAERGLFRERSRAGCRVPVARCFPSDCLTPVMAFQRMRQAGRESFLLESVEGGEALARYTFLGTGPAARLVVRGGSGILERDERVEPLSEAPIRALERLVCRDGFVPDPELPPLASGAVGYLSYDAVRMFESIPDRHPPEGDAPDALFLLYDAVVAFDHPRQRLLLLTTIDRTDGESAEAAAADAIERLDRLESTLSADDRDAARAVVGEPPSFEPRMRREEFLAAVEKAQEAIAEGEVYQLVLSERWTARLEADPFDVYRALRTLNPSPYLFYLETREASLLGSSPEMLVRCRGRRVETRPIAGTAPRGRSPEEDAALASALLADPKERAEHVMLVDLARNDLGRVCEIGSVRVNRYAAVEKFSHVQHLVSEVEGVLAPGRSVADAVEACFPAGTLTGAPKIRAMELIDRLESSRRGVYGGAVGYFDAAGNADLAITIRAAVVERGVCRIQAGAGIVADSVPEKEYREAESKARALFDAVRLAGEWFGSPPAAFRLPPSGLP